MAEKETTCDKNVPFGLQDFTDDALWALLESGKDEASLGLVWDITSAVDSVSLSVQKGSVEVDTSKLEQELRAIWYRAIQLGKHFEEATGYHVIWQLQAAQARGDVLISAGAHVPFRFPNGERLWTDLPFCAEALVRALSQDELVDTDLHGNIIRFAGQLFGSGACEGRFDSVLLHFLRYMLEQPWPPGRLNNPAGVPDDQMVSCRYYSQPGEHPLLGDLRELLIKAGPRLVALSNRSARCAMGVTIMDGSGGSGSTTVDTGLGELAQQAGIEATDGFSPDRWNFWARRLQSVMDESTESPNYEHKPIREMLWVMRRASLGAGGPCAARTAWIADLPAEYMQ